MFKTQMTYLFQVSLIVANLTEVKSCFYGLLGKNIEVEILRKSQYWIINNKLYKKEIQYVYKIQ